LCCEVVPWVVVGKVMEVVLQLDRWGRGFRFRSGSPSAESRGVIGRVMVAVRAPAAVGLKAA